MKIPLPAMAAEAPSIPIQYELPAPDERTALIERGECAGVFVNATLAAASRRFLERLREGPAS